MDWFRGLRAAVALCAPLVLGDIAGIPNLGWAALGGFEAILADQGGPYRSRMASLSTLSLGGAAGLTLGSLAGIHLEWALPVTVLFCFVWSYLAVLGQPFNTAGLLVQVIFICGIGAPTTSWHEALMRGLLLLAGGAWASLLSLLLWPLDPYRPARFAVSSCYSELASFLGSIAELAGRDQQHPALWHRLAQHHQYRVRRAVEQGWQAVAAIRAEFQTESAQGHHLVVLLEHADLLIARTVALAEHLEAPASDTTACNMLGLDSLADLRAAEDFVAGLLTRRGQSAGAAQVERMKLERLPGRLESCGENSGAGTRFLLAQVTRAASLLETSIESAAQLRFGRGPGFKPIPPVPGSVGQFGYVYARLAELRSQWHPERVLDQLRGNFHRESLLLRHAARVAVVCGLDTLIIFGFRIDHGYWLLMTSLIVLQPHVSGTMRRGLERIGGTVGGGILAALLALTLHSQLATAAALFPLALLALAVLPVSYAAFAFFLTPAFVLAWLPYSGDWQLALMRIVNTVLGAVISLLAMAILFPAWERERAPEFLRASLAADRNYLAVLGAAWKSRSNSSRLLANARRATGLAHNDTEESLERLLAESWQRRKAFAQFVAAFVTYLRRVAQSVTTLAAIEGEWEWKQSALVQRRIEVLDRRLQWLELNTGNGADSGEAFEAAWPEGTVSQFSSGQEESRILSLDSPGDRQLERLDRQVEILRRQLNSLREHGWLPDVTNS
jgi:uncharacterized membrane protein YccC